jgi:hypothetical protein
MVLSLQKAYLIAGEKLDDPGRYEYADNGTYENGPISWAGAQFWRHGKATREETKETPGNCQHKVVSV